MCYQTYFYYCVLIISTVNIYSSSPLYTLIHPTEQMFSWINTFMDTHNNVPYKTSVTELHTIINQFHTCLNTCNGKNENHLEKEVHSLISYQLNKLENLYTILARKDAQSMTSIRLGWKLSQVCELPVLVEELDISLNKIIKTAHMVDQSAAHDLQEFYTYSFRPFYRKWHNKSSFYFLAALRKRLSC